MATLEQEQAERLLQIKKLIKEYEELLGDTLHTGDHFDMTRLPTIVQQAIKLVVAKSPGFSNVGALTTVNYVFNHIIGQLRPVINDMVYSDDMLTPNYYGILISPSGSGKDSSYNALLKAGSTALSLLEEERKNFIQAEARKRALKIKLKDEPNATEEDLSWEEIQPFMRDMLNIKMSGDSTRGGVASTLNKFQKEPFGVPSIFMGEFGLDLKNGNTIQELLKLLGSLYDMGVSTPPEFKTDDVKEAEITGMYPNFLGHTSPKILFGNEKVKDSLSSLFHTMLARRCWFTMPTDAESIENNPVPETVTASRKLSAVRRQTISELAPILDNQLVEAVRKMLADPAQRVITFSDEAADLYTDYFEYTNNLSKLQEDSSISQVELAGRAFKVGRLAAVWALVQGQNEISKDTLASVIYFAQYNGRYIAEFVKLTTSKPFILLANVFLQGKVTELTLDTAITHGYIQRVSNDFKELIDPLNSYLRDKGVCTYDDENKIFKYTSFKVAPTTNVGYTMSYTVCDGVPKSDRTSLLASFDKVKENGSFKFLLKLMSTDSVYNVFKYDAAPNKDGIDVPNTRRQDTIISDTRLVSIDVDESPVDMETVHAYLENFKHIICTTSDSTNKRKFRILLFVNVALSAEDPAGFSYVMKRIATDLLVKADPTCFNPAQAMYSYKDSVMLHNENGKLFPITEYIKEYATDTQAEPQILSTKSKTPGERKKKVDKVMGNINQLFDYAISAAQGFGSYSLARASLHMLDLEFNRAEYEMVINYINNIWTSPMPEDRLQHTIIDQFKERFPE